MNNTTFLYKKGGYRFLGKELFNYFCGNCRTEIFNKSKPNYCENCGKTLDWTKTKRVDHKPLRTGY